MRYLSDVVSWIAFRTTRRYNIIKLRGLEPNYWDKDTMLLQAIMQLIVDFVEVECALMSREEPATRRERLIGLLPWALRVDEWSRNAARGVVYLQEQTTLDDVNTPENYRNPPQARAAREILAVYRWWKEVRPNRLNPFVEDDYGKMFTAKKFMKMSSQNNKEDAKMMKRIIDIREYLWT